MEAKTPAPCAVKAVKAGPVTAEMPKDGRSGELLRITPKVRRAIELLATGKTQTEAAEQVGTTRETLCRNLAKPHVIEHLRQRAVRTIAMAAGRAAEVKTELLDCPDSMVRDRSSTFILGVAGIARLPGINAPASVVWKFYDVRHAASTPFSTSLARCQSGRLMRPPTEAALIVRRSHMIQDRLNAFCKGFAFFLRFESALIFAKENDGAT
jgi:hypothetical protein